MTRQSIQGLHQLISINGARIKLTLYIGFPITESSIDFRLVLSVMWYTFSVLETVGILSLAS